MVIQEVIQNWTPNKHLHRFMGHIKASGSQDECQWGAQEH